MSLHDASQNDAIQTEIDKFVGDPGLASGTAICRLSMPSGRVQVVLESVEKLACSVDSIQFLSDRLAACDGQAIKALGEELAQKLAYLTEPISLVEADLVTPVAQLRSTQPQTEPTGDRCYYEVLTDRQAICLVRYSKAVGQSRHRVAMPLTREVLARLLVDLDSAIAALSS